MRETLFRAAVMTKVLRMWAIDKVKQERGEGVISVAIAVLIMAGIGVLVWAGFQQFWSSTSDKTQSNLDQIGG